MTQAEALEILKTGANVFLTGPAGSGKTHLLNAYTDFCRTNDLAVAVTASTGLAATHLNGRTIHSWAGIGLHDELTKAELKKIAGTPTVRKRVRETRVLIIDEISMLDAKRLDLVDQVAQKIRRDPRPFGGLQVIVSGDFFQLPPVAKGGRNAAPNFAFRSAVWKTKTFTVCYLEQQYRQLDMDYYAILNSIRHRQDLGQAKEQLAKRLHASIIGVTKPTKLFSHNADVDAINTLELMEIAGPERSFTMRTSGSQRSIESLQKHCLAPELLTLKKGALVMFVTNNFDAGYVNGTLGEVIGFDDASGQPIVQTKNGLAITAAPATWAFEENGKKLGEISQIPLRLAWAITIHKSQGMSLDCAEIDLGKAFTEGMGYVALSRVRTLEGITLTNLNAMALRVHDEISVYDAELRQHSKQTEHDLALRRQAEIAESRQSLLETDA